MSPITLQTIDLRVIDADSIRELLADYQKLVKSAIDAAVATGKRTAFEPADSKQLAQDRYNLYRAKGLGAKLKELTEASR